MKIEKEILYRYFNGDATPEEEHKIRQYLEASDENWKEYLRERKFFDTIILKEQVVSEEKQMKRRQLIRKISLECLKVAAVLLIAFPCGLPRCLPSPVLRNWKHTAFRSARRCRQGFCLPGSVRRWKERQYLFAPLFRRRNTRMPCLRRKRCCGVAGNFRFLTAWVSA